MYPDFLTCGRCADEFPLSSINEFILHKTACLAGLGGDAFGSSTAPSPLVLSCFLCQQDFHTARGVLQHVQHVHNMDIVQRKDPHHQLDDRDKLVTGTLPSVNSGDIFSTGVESASCGDISLGVESAFRDNTATPSNISNTATTSVSDSPVTTTRVKDSVSISSKEVVMPVACAKLASSVGTTICCNGKECQVTINPPPKTPPPKKCCSSVVPKKRTRHMQEHDTEDIEQSALKTLATLHSRFLRNQKARAGGKKGTRSSSRATHRSRAQCIMRCERKEVLCVSKNTHRCEDNGEEECQASDGEEEDTFDKVCTDDESSCETEKKNQKKKQKIDLYSVERESIMGRKTVMTNSGVTVTLEPTETTTSKNIQTDQDLPSMQAPTSVSTDQNQNVLHVDASRESAQILAELMYHTSRMDQSMASSVQNVPSHITDTQAALASLAEACIANSSTGPAMMSTFPPLNTSFYAGSPVSLGGSSLNSLILHPSIPNPLEINTNIPASAVPTQSSVTSPLDIAHLPDLDALSPSIHSFPSLDHVGQQDSALTVPDIQVSNSSSHQRVEGCMGEEEGKRGGDLNLKKRRYPTSRPHKCSECDQAFNQPVHLRKHMSKHTGVKPFKCEQCDYSTVERSHLKAHNRIHTGEKPFQCPFCSYATAQNSTLKVHLKRHHHQDRSVTRRATPQSTLPP